MNIELEKLWDKMESGKLKEDEVSEIYYALQKEINEIFNFGDDTIFTVTKDIERKASENTRVFIRNNYEVEINIDYQKF